MYAYLQFIQHGEGCKQGIDIRQPSQFGCLQDAQVLCWLKAWYKVIRLHMKTRLFSLQLSNWVQKIKIIPSENDDHIIHQLGQLTKVINVFFISVLYRKLE